MCAVKCLLLDKIFAIHFVVALLRLELFMSISDSTFVILIHSNYYSC